MSPRVEAGNVILCTAPWNSAFVEELAAFNLGAHDDQVDAFSQALNWLMEKERKRGGAVDRELVLKTARLMNERRQQRTTPQWVGVETVHPHERVERPIPDTMSARKRRAWGGDPWLAGE